MYELIEKALAIHPKPWKVGWTSYGESMGTDSRSRIFDANGNVVLTVGHGVWRFRDEDEGVALLIVSAVNGAYNAGGGH